MEGYDYAGVLPDWCFRRLDAEEEQEFRKWARAHTSPEDLARGGVYHPVVRDEWRKMGLWPVKNGRLWGFEEAPGRPVYLVWEARVPGELEVFRVAFSSVRESSLRLEIERGEKQVELVRLVAVTVERNLARAMACCEL